MTRHEPIPFSEVSNLSKVTVPRKHFPGNRIPPNFLCSHNTAIFLVDFRLQSAYCSQSRQNEKSMRLSDFCDIQSGHTARGRLEEVASGGIPALQLSSISTDTSAPWKACRRFRLPHLADRHFIHAGEVVFRSRGEQAIALAAPPTLSEPVVAIAPLMILRPDRDRASPEYLAWAINHPNAQRKLDAQARGTSLRMVPLAVLADLDIPLPDLITQDKIVSADALAKREAKLLQQLAARREYLLTAILGEIAENQNGQGITR